MEDLNNRMSTAASRITVISATVTALKWLSQSGGGASPLLRRFYHSISMKTSIFFPGVFTAGLLTGMEVDWQS